MASYYETAALPAELRRRGSGKHCIPGCLTQDQLQGQDKCLANFAQRDSLWLFSQCGFETFYRFSQRLEAESECLMMHRHDETRACGTSHFNRLLRSEEHTSELQSRQ